jgi:hypothetical protein
MLSDGARPAGDLRSADWRFLLPFPPGGRFEHLVLLGGPPWLADVVVELGIAKKVSRETATEATADALILLEDSRVDVETASACLIPGGVAYWEVRRRWRSFLRSGPKAIRRRLREAGLVPTGLYWPHPGFRQTEMYLPVAARNVLAWYVDTFLRVESPGRVAARLFVKFVCLAGAATRIMALAPRYAVTASAGQGEGQPFVPSAAIPPESDEAAQPLPILLLGGSDYTRRVIVFLLSPGARRPSAVVKFWRSTHRNSRAEAEQETLREIRSQLDETARGSLPQPLGIVPWGGIVAAAESCVSGAPLSQLAARWGRPMRSKLEDLRLVFDWVTEFHRQAQLSRAPWGRAALERWVEEPLAAYQAGFGVRTDEERLFSRIRRDGRSLVGVPLPIVWAHPDLTGANIHRSGRRVSVIDWSGAAPRLPYFDVLYFVLLWTCRLRGLRGPKERLRCFRDLFIEADAGDGIVRTMREALARYNRDLEIDPRFFPLLMVLSWVDRSVACLDRARAVARGEPGANPHPEESYVEFVRILAEPETRLWQPGG